MIFHSEFGLAYSEMYNWEIFQLCLIQIPVQLLIELVNLIEMFTGFDNFNFNSN